MSDVEDWPTEQWVYIGRRIGVKGILYAFLDEKGVTVAFRKAPRNKIIGGVYEVETKDERVRIESAKYIGKAKIIEDEWVVADKEAYAEQQRESTEKRLAKEQGDIGRLTLDEISTLYHKHPPGRSTFLAIVLSHITGMR